MSKMVTGWQRGEKEDLWPWTRQSSQWAAVRAQSWKCQTETGLQTPPRQLLAQLRALLWIQLPAGGRWPGERVWATCGGRTGGDLGLHLHTLEGTRGCTSVTPVSLSWFHLQAWPWVHARHQGAAVPKPSQCPSPAGTLANAKQAEASRLFSLVY